MDNVSKEYIIKSLEKGIRLDGRKLEEYRELEVGYDVSKNAEGSARVKIGDTEVIAGVKLEIGTPYPDRPDEGTIIVSAEMLPMSSDGFESGPPSVESIELSRVVDRAIRESDAVDFKKLCIEKGEKVWMVLIDIYSINNDGNLQDAACLAALAALNKTKLPGYDGEVIDYKVKKDKLAMNLLPVECTTVKIGNSLLSDPDVHEEKWSEARLTVATTDKGEVCAMQKGGEGVLSAEDIKNMVLASLKNGKMLRDKLK
jgi:exosome complex component RRP42